MVRRSARQARQIRIAAHDAVHHNDVGSRDIAGGIDEVHHLALDPILQARFAQELGGACLVRRRQLHAHGARQAGLQQLDLDGADPTANLEKRLAFQAAFLQQLHDST